MSERVGSKELEAVKGCKGFKSGGWKGVLGASRSAPIYF